MLYGEGGTKAFLRLQEEYLKEIRTTHFSFLLIARVRILPISWQMNLLDSVKMKVVRSARVTSHCVFQSTSNSDRFGFFVLEITFMVLAVRLFVMTLASQRTEFGLSMDFRR
jgi:hypothetical protein